MIPARNNPADPGATRWSHTDIPPADSPAIVEVVSDINKDYPPYKFHQPRLP